MLAVLVALSPYYLLKTRTFGWLLRPSFRSTTNVKALKEHRELMAHVENHPFGISFLHPLNDPQARLLHTLCQLSSASVQIIGSDAFKVVRCILPQTQLGTKRVQECTR